MQDEDQAEQPTGDQANAEQAEQATTVAQADKETTGTDAEQGGGQ